MSSFSAYCLNCGEVIRRVEHDEVAFCTLACQTRALLIVAEAQQRQEGPYNTGSYSEEAPPKHKADTSSTKTSFTVGKTTGYSKPDPRQGSILTSSLTSRAPVPAAPASGAVQSSAQTARQLLSARPPLHTRHSLARVNNLVAASEPTIQHPIMNTLRSDIFSVASVAHPHANRTFSTGNGSSGGPRPTASTNTAARNASLATKAGSSIPSTSSFFSSPSSSVASLNPASHPELENLSEADALYRQHYPKFASRRHLRDHSPNIPTHMSDSSATPASMHMDSFNPAQLLTPPSTIRPLLVLPEVGHHLAGENPPPPTPASQPTMDAILPGSVTEATSQKQKVVVIPAHPPLPISPLFRHTPERRSAPRRSLEISPSASQEVHLTGSDAVALAGSSESPSRPRSNGSAGVSSSSNILRPGLRTNGSGSGRKSDSFTGNSLGLEIQHVESTSAPLSQSATPPVEVNENMEPYSDKQPLVGKAKVSNPVSPPKLRSRLKSMHTAPAGGRRDIPGSDGWRSVEASRYTLGPREASYIVRKLSEEQKKRQQKERAAAKEESMESRGRSRVRKRAGSWGNSLQVAGAFTYFSLQALALESRVVTE